MKILIIFIIFSLTSVSFAVSNFDKERCKRLARILVRNKMVRLSESPMLSHLKRDERLFLAKLYAKDDLLAKQQKELHEDITLLESYAIYQYEVAKSLRDRLPGEQKEDPIAILKVGDEAKRLVTEKIKTELTKSSNPHSAIQKYFGGTGAVDFVFVWNAVTLIEHNLIFRERFYSHFQDLVAPPNVVMDFPGQYHKAANKTVESYWDTGSIFEGLESLGVGTPEVSSTLITGNRYEGKLFFLEEKDSQSTLKKMKELFKHQTLPKIIKDYLRTEIEFLTEYQLNCLNCHRDFVTLIEQYLISQTQVK